MKRREMKLLLEERFERIALLETRIDTMDQLVEGYRAREQAILDTLQSAKENAAHTIEQATAEAAKTRETAASEAKAMIDEAASASEALRAEAERRAKEIMITAKAESDRMLRDAEIIKREYEEMVDLFNAMLEHNASELQTSAARFAEFMKSSKIDSPEPKTDGEAFYKSVGALRDVSLPDPSGDPARLMQNIYRIQNRPMPEDKAGQSADETGLSDQQGEQEPYSEAAWASESQQSSSEPQAEFAKSFDNAYNESAFVVRADGCHFTQAQAENLFDALFSAPEFTAKTAGAKNAPEPAEINDETTTAGQPSEAVQAFDDMFSKQAEPEGKRAQDEVSAALAQGPEGNGPQETQFAEPTEAQAEETEARLTEPKQPTADEQSDLGKQPERETVSEHDAFSAFDAFMQVGAKSETPEQPATETEPAAPATPYSEAAWENHAQPSGLEPQAEGTLFTSGMPSDASDSRAAGESGGDWIHAIDDLLAGIGVASAAAVAAAPEPEPAVEPPEPAFKDAFTPAYANTAPQEESAPSGVSEYEAEHAFDDFIRHQADSFVSSAEAAVTQPAPFSEAAWKNSARMSGLEPQAEGNLFSAETDIAQEAEFTLEKASEEAMREIDDALGQYGEQTPPASETAAEPARASIQPEPYSESAWAESAPIAALEPQAEGTLFSSEEGGVTEPVKADLDPTADEVRRLGDLLAEYKGSFTTVDEAAFAQAVKSMAEPAIKAAGNPAEWQTNAAESAVEPRTENGMDAAEEPRREEYTEEEPAPAPRRYSDFGEVREWEPEPEPDLGDLPTVSRYVGGGQTDEEVTLDDLLDEIIKAGE